MTTHSTSPLTKEFLTAMKTCDRAYCHLDQEKKQGTLTLVKRIANGSFTEEAKIEHTFSAHFTDYGKRYTPRDHFLRAYFSLGTAQQSGAWQALCLILRPDDELTLTAVVNNDSQNMRENGYNRDELQMTISRKGKPLISRWTLESEVCPNNTARPIQHANRKPREDCAA